MGIKYTILTPVYNRFDLLDLAAKSVIEQTYENWEWIIYNDGSDQAVTPYIQDKLKIKDDRIRIIENKKNGGLITARNALLKNCKTKWACWFDSDDANSIYRLEYADKYIRKNPKLTWVWTQYNSWFGDGDIDYKKKPIIPDKKFIKHYVTVFFNSKLAPKFRNVRMHGCWTAVRFEDQEWYKRFRKIPKFKEGWFKYSIYYYRHHENRVTEWHENKTDWFKRFNKPDKK